MSDPTAATTAPDKPYTVGRYHDPKQDDPAFAEIQEAFNAAVLRSEADERELIAIWNGNATQWLYTGGEVFKLA